MSMENAKAFYEKVTADQGLQQKIGGLAKEDPKGIEGIILKVAKENGFEFTAEEMKAFTAEKAKTASPTGELNDSELEAVAGGKLVDWIMASALSCGVYCAATAGGKAAGLGCNLDNDWN